MTKTIVALLLIGSFTVARADERRTDGLVVGGAGVAALIAGAVFFELGTRDLDDEHALCPGHLCATDADTTKANALKNSGRMDRGVGIGMGIGGLTLVAVGAIVLASSKTESSPVALRVDHHGASLSYTLAF